ncbi:hypothetical protein [Pedobacter glucosidilyticus]|uniref:hypothetical protein n=1 Tax=Pedobacter glucosidilyticus TaxID=1122941 RepID=UPI0026EA98A1|nr:hypothetical protein [Pedobacter glucosidilyticus]
MIGEELVIMFNNKQAFLVKDKPLRLEQLGLSDYAISKGFKLPAYWKFKVLKHLEDEKKIVGKIITYYVGETEFGPNQIEISNKLSQIEQVTFRGIDTQGLINTLLGKVPISHHPPESNQYEKVSSSFNTPQPKPHKETITDTFFIPLKEVYFIHGGVTFSCKLANFPKPFDFTIQNDDIREEYDAVKNYFSNVLKTKKIQVFATVELTNNEVTTIDSKSPEIEKIDKEIIDNVRFDYVKTTLKKLNIEVDKNLFTMDEFFETFTDEKLKSNTFYENDASFFEDILKIQDTKHYKNLRFLSNKHAHHILKLRFIHKPFSFIFLIEGEKHYHFIWETLNTKEATYIWHVSKDPKLLNMRIERLENILNFIKVNGKTAYISTEEDPFIRIEHDYSAIKDGFIKWKSKIESILT